MKAVVAVTLALGLTILAAPAMAEAAWWRLDRIENRIDRRESIVDRRTDHGRIDVVEDYFDRIEGRADRRNTFDYRAFDVHEWRTARWKLLRH